MPKKKKSEVKLNWKTAYDLLQERQSLQRLSTKTAIDELIGGGLEEGTVTEFYGEFGSGKSQICFTLAAIVAGELDMDVVFIDCEQTFKPERIAEIARNRGYDPTKVLQHIYLIQPLTVDEQMAALNSIPETVKPKLIIVDGATTLFRSEYIGRETLAERQGLLRQFLKQLKNYVKQNKIWGIVTNQVYQSPDGTIFMPLDQKELSVGGHSWWHMVDDRIFLRKSTGTKRIAKLVDSSMHPPAERPFQITEKGVEQIGEILSKE